MEFQIGSCGKWFLKASKTSSGLFVAKKTFCMIMKASFFPGTTQARKQTEMYMNHPDSEQSPSFYRRLLDRLLKGTHDHFLCYLPENIGFLPSLFLKLFYSGMKIDQEQIRVIQNIPKDAIIVYASQNKTLFEFFFYFTRYRKEKIPFPEIALDFNIWIFQPISRLFRSFISGLDHMIRCRRLPNPYESHFVQSGLENGKAAFLALVEEKGFYKRFVKDETDPIRYLIDMQQEIDRPIFIVPQLIFFTKKPPRSVPTLKDLLFGPEQRPGWIRRVATLFRRPGQIFVEVSSPLNLKAYLALQAPEDLDSKQLSRMVRQKLLHQLSRHRQSITGPVLKSVEELKENILTNARLQDFMRQYSEKRDIPLSKVHKKADAYLTEIASDITMVTIKIGEAVVRWFLKVMFEGITVNSEVLNRVKQKAQEAPLVLIPCHKSHIDYLMLSYLLHSNNMPCPQVAAGKNLSFWPLGPLFRGGGAFFIRRTFKGAVLYARVFKEYIHKLLEEGFNIEFFIEGGRSRTGKLLMPKLGLLNILLETYRNGACNDLIFVPIYIGYDRVLEESAYLHEIGGGKKEDENLWQVIRAGKFLKKRYGKIYIKFHEPLSLNDMAAEKGFPLHEMPQKAQNAFCRELGSRLINAIDKLTVVTPHAVVASALLNCPKSPFAYQDFIQLVDTYMSYLYDQQADLSDTLIYEHTYAIEQVLSIYIQRKFVEKISKSLAPAESDSKDVEAHAAEDLYLVNENKRQNLEYYKNNGISVFIPAAFTSLAILEIDAFQFSISDIHPGYSFLQDFFQNEFTFDLDKTPSYLVRKTLKIFINEAVVMPHATLPDRYNLTSAGFRTLKTFAMFLKTFFESYWIVLNFLMKYPQKKIKLKDRTKKIQVFGNKMLKKNLIERPEALSRAYIENAADLFSSIGIHGAEDTEKLQFYSNAIRRYLNILS
jgi:glycerol-3-phosphate O-acyltransferase